MTEKQFFRLTPRLFQILCDRKYANDRRELANSALITATILNVNRPKNKSAVKIEDIIGKDSKETKDEEVPLIDFIKNFATKKKRN